MKISIPKYTLAEELISSISHGCGAIFGIVALVLCVNKTETATGYVGASLYGSFMFLMYVISCVYHALPPHLTGKKVMRVIDHCTVLLMVAGTFMPLCLNLIKGALGWTVFGIVWGMTIISIILNCIGLDKFKRVSAICSLIMGWSAIFLIKPIYYKAGLTALILLITGGIVYSLGAILFSLGKKYKYMHSIFHFFVIGGSILHFIFIYAYCL